jgi:trimeric autotransporter adhesin
MYDDSLTNELIVTGTFREDAANCIPMTGSARWNGIRWDSTQNFYTAGLQKFALTRYNGTLIMDGFFYWPPSGYYQLATWSGSTWDTLPNSPNYLVTCFTEHNGELFMAGCFDQLGNDSTLLLGKYDGQTLTGCVPYEGSNIGFGYRATCLAVYHDTLYMGGDFTSLANPLGASDFVRYVNGILDTVHPQFIGNGAASYIEDMVVFRDELYIAGYFRKQDGFTGDYIMKWDGTQFTEVGGGVNGRVNTLAVHNDRLYVGGYFTQAGDSATSLLAIWDGVSWQTFNDTFPVNTIIRDIAFYNDSMIISGNFKWINGDTVNHIAKYNHTLPTDVPDSNSHLATMVYPNPGTNTVNIQLSGIQQGRELIIYDAVGREVWRKKYDTNVISIDVSNYTNGIYVYTIVDSIGDVGRGKFIVNH